MSYHPLKIIHSFNLVNTFLTCSVTYAMSPDSRDSHMKIPKLSKTIWDAVKVTMDQDEMYLNNEK